MSKPTRSVERDYLAALADAVPLATWREICKRAAEQAKQGHPKARDFLARYLLGERATADLLALAADEHAGYTSEAAIEQESKSRGALRILSNGGPF